MLVWTGTALVSIIAARREGGWWRLKAEARQPGTAPFAHARAALSLASESLSVLLPLGVEAPVVLVGSDNDNIVRTLNINTCAAADFATLPQSSVGTPVTVIELAAAPVPNTTTEGAIAATGTDGSFDFLFLKQPGGAFEEIASQAAVIFDVN